ncbi:MAG: DNA-formamidopyrimidine glycosylase family protein [Acidimicrobiales bacterium]
MPEGDTLHNTALRLRPALVGRRLATVSFPRLRGVDRVKAGDLVTRIESRGKYLEIEVDRGLVVRSHLQMTGSWDLYRRGDRWRKPRHLARAVLETDAAAAVCFSAPVVEIGRPGDGRLDHLGPDLCVAPVDIDEILRRVAAWADPRAEIAEVLLEQRLAAGIGNVYKCETLFACGVDPFLPLADVAPAMQRSLYETAAAQLQANLGRGRRATFGDGLAVYGRDRQGCRVCGAGISSRIQGGQGRRTWWCPRCQPSLG